MIVLICITLMAHDADFLCEYFLKLLFELVDKWRETLRGPCKSWGGAWQGEADASFCVWIGVKY